MLRWVFLGLARRDGDVIAFADFDAVVAQDIVRGDQMKIEVRQGKTDEIGLALESRVLAADLEEGSSWS